MGISHSYALILTLALGYEYWFKQWWSDFLGKRTTRPLCNYVLYRLVHLVLLVGSGLLLFPSVDLATWALFSSCLVLLGSLELFVGSDSNESPPRGRTPHFMEIMMPTPFWPSRQQQPTPRFGPEKRI